MIMDYFKKVICGDINNYEIKKQIVKTFIREIIVYNDLIVILYNFTLHNMQKMFFQMMFQNLT